jgi:predicted enzyme related to lactoylglutathione lyase
MGGRAALDMEVQPVGNKIVHAEVVGKDGAALHDFYGKLFDWKQNRDLPGGYAMTDHEDSGIVLGTGPAPDGGAGWVTFYVSVSDLDATLAKAVDLGGQVVMPRFSPAPETWLAMVADPEGHVIGLSQGA